MWLLLRGLVKGKGQPLDLDLTRLSGGSATKRCRRHPGAVQRTRRGFQRLKEGRGETEAASSLPSPPLAPQRPSPSGRRSAPARTIESHSSRVPEIGYERKTK